jgi:hypothetical protein
MPPIRPPTPDYGLSELGPTDTGGPAHPDAMMRRYRQMEQEGRLGRRLGRTAARGIEATPMEGGAAGAGLPPGGYPALPAGGDLPNELRMTPAPEASYINRLRKSKWDAELTRLRRSYVEERSGEPRRLKAGGEMEELGPLSTGGYNPNAMLERLTALDEAGELYHPGPEYLNPSRWRGNPSYRESDKELMARLHRVSAGRPRFPRRVMEPYHQAQARNLLPETIAGKAREQWGFSLPAQIQRRGGSILGDFLNANWAAAKPKWTMPAEVGLPGREPWYRGPIPWPHFENPEPDRPKSAAFGGPRAPGEGLFNPISPGI